MRLVEATYEENLIPKRKIKKERRRDEEGSSEKSSSE